MHRKCVIEKFSKLVIIHNLIDNILRSEIKAQRLCHFILGPFGILEIVAFNSANGQLLGKMQHHRGKKDYTEGYHQENPCADINFTQLINYPLHGVVPKPFVLTIHPGIIAWIHPRHFLKYPCKVFFIFVSDLLADFQHFVFWIFQHLFCSLYAVFGNTFVDGLAEFTLKQVH